MRPMSYTGSVQVEVRHLSGCFNQDFTVEKEDGFHKQNDFFQLYVSGFYDLRLCISFLHNTALVTCIFLK